MALTEQDKQATYEAGIAGGLSPEEASSIAGGYSPTGAGSISDQINAAGGAAGRFDNVDEGNEGSVAAEDALSSGVPLSETGTYARNDYVIQEGQYKGMTKSQADAKKVEQGDQQSALTSYSFTPESIGNTKKAMDSFNLSLNDSTNDPFTGEGQKLDDKNIRLDLTAKDIAKGFNSAQDFYVASQNNEELQGLIQPFIDNGGSLSQIATKISKPVTETGEQDTASYLESLKQESSFDITDPFEIKAMALLAPETDLAQKEVMRQAGIAQDLQDLYFGTEEKLGILDETKRMNEERKKLIEQKELSEKLAIEDRAQYSIDKNNADAEMAKAEIETNRLNAKNYMTGMLAKLGALSTTGKAPQALSVLEQKYQQQKQQLDTKLTFANRAIEIDLSSDLNDLIDSTDELILNLEEDLSLDTIDASKKVFEAQQKAETQMYSLISKSATELRKTTETYRKEATTISNKYNQSFLYLAGKGVNVSQISKHIKADGTIDTTTLTNTMFADKEEISQSTNQKNDIASAILGFRELMELREQRGVDPTEFKEVSSMIRSEYGAAAVLELEKAILEDGLFIDYEG